MREHLKSLGVGHGMDLGKIRILPTLTSSDMTTGEILILNTHTHTHTHTHSLLG
jgi:hypothetical protein